MALAVNVDFGTAQINGVSVPVAADSLTLGAADATDPRFDLIVTDDAGVVAVVAGTPDLTPVFPAIPADTVVLAAVYVPALLTDLTEGNIVDKRVLVPRHDLLDMPELSDPGAPDANVGRLYFEDNGSGKTRLVVRFPTGSVQVIKTEA